MLKLAAALTVLLIAMPKPGICDWQYTRWGMTPEQVKSVSKGQATENPTVEVQSTKSGDALLTTSYRSGTLDFKVYFLFERRTKRLEGVKLELVDSTKGAELYAQLIKSYGRPVSQDNTQLMRVARWLDRKNRNSIAWMTVGFTSTSVQYSALTAEPGRGV